MSQIRGRNTRPELILRKELWKLGFRYRIKNKLPGKPDLVFKSYGVVVFVDGCFWHKCPKHFIQPKTRSDFWMEKINGNVERDKLNNKSLQVQGWQVVRIWEHEIKESLENAIVRVVEVLRKKKRD